MIDELPSAIRSLTAKPPEDSSKNEGALIEGSLNYKSKSE